VSDIRDCKSDLYEDIGWLREQLSSRTTPLDKKIEAAMVLWDLSEMAREALEPFKDELREHALKSEEPKWCYHAGNIQATVVTPSNRVKLKRGADISPLRGSPEYGELIEELTTYRVRQGADTSNLPNEWYDVLKVENPTPRVSLTRKGSLPGRGSE
jgi:hypothetical protein